MPRFEGIETNSLQFSAGNKPFLPHDIDIAIYLSEGDWVTVELRLQSEFYRRTGLSPEVFGVHTLNNGPVSFPWKSSSTGNGCSAAILFSTPNTLRLFPTHVGGWRASWKLLMPDVDAGCRQTLQCPSSCCFASFDVCQNGLGEFSTRVLCSPRRAISPLW